MQSNDETTDDTKHGRLPASMSQRAPAEEMEVPRGDETFGQASESAAYTSEEESLVEERLKNLGYL